MLQHIAAMKEAGAQAEAQAAELRSTIAQLQQLQLMSEFKNILASCMEDPRNV
jgi:hypothetical protein